MVPRRINISKSNCSFFQGKDIPAIAFLSYHIKILKLCHYFKNKVRSMINVDDNDNSDNEKYDLRFNQLDMNHVWLEVMTKLQYVGFAV